jgi:hypothetical protein
VKKNMRSSLFPDIAQRRLVVTDVSGQPVGPIFKPRAAQEGCLTSMRSTGCPQTSVTNYRWSGLRNVTEQRRSHLHGGGILKSRAKVRWHDVIRSCIACNVNATTNSMKKHFAIHSTDTGWQMQLHFNINMWYQCNF